MTLYLATGNLHKKKEMQEICRNHTILIPADKGIDFNPEETGDSFFETDTHAAPDTLRRCRYVCAMVLYSGKDRFYCVQETFEGTLIEDIEQSRGKGGFGYDPIVFLSEYGKTVAELSDEEKNAVSHRGKAARKILQLL